MGKTFVALALAREFVRPIVLAPAAVREAWTRSAQLARVPVTVVSLERMSRPSPPPVDADLVIIDEAQHVGTRGTARRRAVAACCAGRAVLLLSATPVRNRLAELDELMAMFLGSEILLDPEMRSQCIVRRAQGAGVLPAIVSAPPLAAPRTAALDREILELPAAVPLLEGGTARALVAMGLLRARGSSIAALVVALSRRLQRGQALEAALAQGEWPTAAALRRWLVADDTVQLQLPLGTPRTDTGQWHDTLRVHCVAVRTLLARARRFEAQDSAARAARLHSLLATHANVPVIAFAQHAATVRALYRELRTQPHVALLTADGAQAASGRRPRRDLIAALAPRAAAGRPSHDRVRLVLTTDLLSEGVNLQGAGVVVHLDLPWTPARVRQRLGRVARMGTELAVVHEYFMEQSPAVERAVALRQRLRRKQRAGEQATAASDANEQLRELLTRWPTHAESPVASTSLLPAVVPAIVQGAQEGFLAVVERAGERVLVGGRRKGRRVLTTTDPARLVPIVASVTLPLVPAGSVPTCQRQRMERALARFLQHWGARHLLDRQGPRTVVRRRLMLRAMNLLRHTPVASRRTVATAIAELRGALRRAPGAGVEPLLGRALQEPVGNELLWLERTHMALSALATPAAAHGPARPTEDRSGGRTLAMLVVVTRG